MSRLTKKTGCCSALQFVSFSTAYVTRRYFRDTGTGKVNITKAERSEVACLPLASAACQVIQ